ncbi:MAG: OsmC family protein [Candidatus Kapaibacterium sp.]|nr:OsmC family protein [Ignavibacteriota bacterium]MCB9220821.1 OsmC family protein [Ignavibacteria bacterium]
MVKISVDYLGDLYCKVTHTPSGKSFKTNAPIDNKGKGDEISPTDLVAASIASCVTTIMGIKANEKNIDIEGMNITCSKIMTNVPFRRIDKLILDITFPHPLIEDDFKMLSNVVKTCPVTRSLTSEIELEYNFNYAK